MLFPIKDDDRGISGPCWFTHLFLWANVAIFLFQLTSEEFTYGYSTVPYEITTGIDLEEPILFPNGDGKGGTVEMPHAPGPSPIHLTLISSMFMHGGFMHLIGNMLFLWIFGDNVEHRFGSKLFLIFYLVTGIVASFAQIAMDPSSKIPSLGASGAVSGVMGAYLVLFPRNRVNAIFIIFIISLPAFVVIGLWAVMQFFGGLGAIAKTVQTGGVAYAAHIGGFVAGVLLALLHKRKFTREPDSILYRNYREDPKSKRLFGTGSRT